MVRIHGEDTICAVSTAWGESALGIIRVSGPDAISVAAKIFRSSSGRDPSGFRSHTVHYGHAVDADGGTVDEVMLTVFRKPRSYTREDIVEISTHGGMKILKTLLALLIKNGARLAEPGEFTKRAFLNGRLDLAQAEAVMDLIRARTDSAQKQAVRALQGEFSKKIAVLREKLLRLCAVAEAHLDFPEEDLGSNPHADIPKDLAPLMSEIRDLIEGYKQGVILREGFLAVIAGRPNVGKSSILNALLDRDRAIVSHIPGTTRDALEEELEIGGVLVRIVDTAGISEKAGAIEKIGIQRAQEYLEQAELVLMVVDGSRELSDEDGRILKKIGGKKHLLVVNKSDLALKIGEGSLRDLGSEAPAFFVSAKDRAGFRELEAGILDIALRGQFSPGTAWVARLRHKDALERTEEALKAANEGFERKLSLEFIAFDLRQALARLGEITGEVYTDDILEVIFREFCIGK